METPPFAARAVTAVLAGQPRAATDAPTDPSPRRARLADLDAHFHCSVIGTCLGTGALRKVVRRLVPGASAQDSDLDVHHDAVSLAMDGGAGAKAIGKALDEQHAATIRRYAGAVDAEALGRLWAEALQSGEIPGAYWALMTHPLAGVALRNRAFGDVHMLSHLVGAANRADIRRLVALEAANAALQAHNDRLQARLQDAAAGRDAQLAQAHADLADARGRGDRLAAHRVAFPVVMDNASHAPPPVFDVPCLTARSSAASSSSPGGSTRASSRCSTPSTPPARSTAPRAPRASATAARGCCWRPPPTSRARRWSTASWAASAAAARGSRRPRAGC